MRKIAHLPSGGMPTGGGMFVRGDELADSNNGLGNSETGDLRRRLIRDFGS